MSRLLLILVGIIILLTVGIGAYQLVRSKPSTSYMPDVSKKQQSVTTSLGTEERDQSDATPPLLLKGVGINLDSYDPATGKAGDLVFTKQKLQFNVLFTEYGFVIPASISAGGQDKPNPQPTWIVPIGTKVQAIVDGIVTNVTHLYSNDYSIMVASNKESQWQYETEHVANPLVKVGDKVKAGQVIAEVSPHNKDGNAGYGMVEIGILKGGNPPKHICPFDYLDPSVKDDIQKKLLAFYRSWEVYRGDTTLHDEAAQSVPGCLTHDPIEG